MEKSLKLLEGNKNDSQDREISLMKLFITMLEHLHGRIDAFMQFILKIALQQSERKTLSVNYELILAQTITMCFWYNPILSLDYLSH